VLVIFDVDGTLTRTSELNDRAFAQAFEEVMRVPLQSRDWTQYPRVTARGLLEDGAQLVLGRAPSPDERKAVRDRFIELLATHLFSLKDSLEVPGAVQAFDRLQRSQHSVALATGDWAESAQVKLERAGFEIDEVPMASSDDAAAREAIIETAWRRAGGPEAHRHVVYVGDEVWDLNAARSLGLAVIGVSADGDNALHEAGAQSVLRDFVDYHLFEAHLLKALSDR